MWCGGSWGGGKAGDVKKRILTIVLFIAIVT